MRAVCSRQNDVNENKCFCISEMNNLANQPRLQTGTTTFLTGFHAARS